MVPFASQEHKEGRRDEIIAACGKLYRAVGYRDLTIKALSEETSLSRPSIYNYFETKEEIVLALLTQEYRSWCEALEELSGRQKVLGERGFSRAIARILSGHDTMLKIMAMNLYEIEDNSRLSCLVAFKQEYQRALTAFTACVAKHAPSQGKAGATRCTQLFFPYLLGIYPYAYPTDKQVAAMDEVGIAHPPTTIEELVYRFLSTLLSRSVASED